MHKNHFGTVVHKSKKYSIVNCKSCGFHHLDPLPDLSDLEKMYTHEFYQDMKPEYIKKDESELPYWNITFDDKLDILEKKVKSRKPRILDIGCGPGFFLKRAKTRGWEVLGIEPSTEAVNYAKKMGINVVQSILETYKPSDKKFDAIHSKFLLEHVLDPKETCNLCYNLLKPKGLICFEVPNDFNLLQKIVIKKLKKPFYWIAPPQHINYFSLSSLTKLLQKTGFKIFYYESTFPLELFLLFGLDYVNNDKIGRKIHSMRMNLESALFSTNNNKLKRDLYHFLAKQGLGREIIIYAQKI